MSITVEDVMKLPSMRNSRVLGGKAGLRKNVYGVTVFEGASDEGFRNLFFRQNQGRLESLVVITSFAAIADNVELQCLNIRDMAAAGEVAIVVYYTGIVVKNIDAKLLQAADELEIPLIAMPSEHVDTRYSDLIAELSEAVLMDRQHLKGTLVTEIIGQITKLPKERQTVDSVLSMLSSKLHVSLILTDSNLKILGFAPWPLQNSSMADLITEENVNHHIKRRKAFSPMPGSYIWFAPIHDAGMDGMRLFFIEGEKVLNDALVDMAQETVQLAVELWSSRHSAVMTSELVRAILNDEPIRMRRLSELLHIDIKNIHTTWLIRRTDGKEAFPAEAIDEVRSIMKCLDSDIIIEPYRTTLGDSDDLVIFFRNPLDIHLLDDCASRIIARLRSMGIEEVFLTMLDYKFTTSDVRSAYAMWNENEKTARTAFPLLSVFHESEIELARQCNEILRLGEASIAAATGCLDALSDRPGAAELISTLEVYFLDADMNMQTASEIMKVHKNTIKYRIKIISDVLGFSVSNPVTTGRLSVALCIKRLLDKAVS